MAQGKALEAEGLTVLRRMGLDAVGSLNQVLLSHLDPKGAYAAGDNTEFDYLIPYERVCLVGEISGKTGVSGVESKYRRFVRNYAVLERAQPDEALWKRLGVPDERLRDFHGVRSFHAFMIVPHLENLDVDFQEAPRVAVFFGLQWARIEEYATAIGKDAKGSFLQAFDLPPRRGRRPVTIEEGDESGLVTTGARRIASTSEAAADVFTFMESPYTLLPLARVFRRDELPALPSGGRGADAHYQRPLMTGKLEEIRKTLRRNADFMFPSSILVVLSDGASFRRTDDGCLELTIPERYGSLAVIDGQHRLFSYADDRVRAKQEADGKILVTAVKFAEGADVERESARIFVEINTNQTRVPSTHLDAIAWPILRVSTPRALSAQVLLRANARKNAKLYGLLITSQTRQGLISAKTVLGSLTTYVSKERIQEARDNPRRASWRAGYQKLLGLKSLEGLSNPIDPEKLISHATSCFVKFFDLVADCFPADWPRRGGPRPGSALELAKMIAALVRLLRTLSDEGLGWKEVEAELDRIRSNVLKKRRMTFRPDRVVLDIRRETSPIPGAQAPLGFHYRFLLANRTAPTSVREIEAAVLQERARRAAARAARGSR